MSNASILGDITVLDLTEGIAGGWCTKLLAMLGARVIKVEPPGGEAGRSLPPFAGDRPGPERSGPFLYLNAAKLSVTLDLTGDDGRAALRDLAERADVVVEGFAPGRLAQWGIGFGTLRAANPGLILVSITPFGQDGPYRDYLANELILQAIGGVMYPVGLPEREPIKVGGNLALHNAGSAAFSAIMAALWQRDSTGEGQFIDISMHEAAAITQIHASVLAAWGTELLTRKPDILVEAKDGWVSLGLEMGVAADTWARVCAVMGRPELAEDPRFATTAARRENRLALIDAVQEWVRQQPKEQVYHLLQGMRTIAGFVATTADLHASAQFTDRQFFHTVDHPVTGPARSPGEPFRVGDEPPVRGRAPLLGEHTAAVLGGELRAPSPGPATATPTGD